MNGFKQASPHRLERDYTSLLTSLALYGVSYRQSGMIDLALVSPMENLTW